jgi:TolB-like protein
MSGKYIAINGWLVKPPARFLVKWLIGWCCVGLGCVPSKVQVQSAPQFDPSRITSVAVLPFQAIPTPQWGSVPTRGGVRDPEEIRTQFRLPGADQVDMTESRKDPYVVPETAARRITTKVVSALASRSALRVIGPSESSAIVRERNGEPEPSLTAVAREVGTRLKVDGVLTGLVRTYREREGSKLGAKPAAVGFAVYLVRPSDGTVLWTGEFFEEQKPLTQDVFGFFEKGGGFITADELAELGVQKVMKAFPVGLGGTGPRPPAASLRENP